MKNKPHWIELAEVIDSLRIYPRIIVFGYCFFVYKVVFFILTWYANEAATARGTEESAVVGIVVTAVTGFGPLIFKIYTDGGRDWNVANPPTVQAAQP